MVVPAHYDAFISYAHEDVAAATWLWDLLQRHPVAGRERRTVFLDREHVAAVGPLPDRLVAALAASRHLIVLASPHSAQSDWVNEEIAEFARRHGVERIVVCHVGGDDLPAAYCRLVPGDKRPHRPDLRGDWKKPSRAGMRLRVQRAMSVLAPVVGLTDPSSLLAALRSRRRRWLGGLATAALLSASWVGARTAWTETIWHAHEADLRALARDAAAHRVDDAAVLDGIHALAAAHRLDEAEQVADLLPEGMLRTLGGAVIGAHAADCAPAITAVQNTNETYLQRYGLAAVTVAARCGRAEIADRARPGPDVNGGDEAWALYWLRAGAVERAWALVNASAWETRATVATAAADAGRLSDAGPPVACDDIDAAMTLSRLSGAVDRAGLGSTPAGRSIIDAAAACFDAVAIESGTLWNELARIAAALARAGDMKLARRSVARLDEVHAARARRGPAFAVGWALRGLALQRLGEATAGDASFQAAIRAVLDPIEASRSWSEASEVAEVLTQAGRWPEAYRLAAAVPDTHGRVLARIRLLERWYGSPNAASGWARWASSIDTVLALR
jgi:hypothetical protein